MSVRSKQVLLDWQITPDARYTDVHYTIWCTGTLVHLFTDTFYTIWCTVTLVNLCNGTRIHYSIWYTCTALSVQLHCTVLFFADCSSVVCDITNSDDSPNEKTMLKVAFEVMVHHNTVLRRFFVSHFFIPKLSYCAVH